VSGEDVEVAERYSLTRAGLERWLAELEQPEGHKVTLCVKPGHLSPYLGSIAHEYGSWLQEVGDLPASLAESDTGLVLFWSDDRKYVLLPPFPIDLDQSFPVWDASYLRELRLGGYSVGVFEGERLLTSKTGPRFVKGRHRAGGQSQRRFARRREEQTRELFDKACSVVTAKFAEYEKRLDYVFLGGDRLTLLSFLKRCEYLQGLSGKTMGRVLQVAKPRYEALRNAPSQIWKTRVFVVR
jgi:hypothetical protein